MEETSDRLRLELESTMLSQVRRRRARAPLAPRAACDPACVCRRQLRVFLKELELAEQQSQLRQRLLLEDMEKTVQVLQFVQRHRPPDPERLLTGAQPRRARAAAQRALRAAN
eukprot:scaffold1852_cov282-Prasinococcus_capsulatus_cf.AAC.5